MKNYGSLPVLLILLFLFSCQEEDVTQNNVNSNPDEVSVLETPQDKLARVNQSMKILAQFSLGLSKSESARSNIYKLVQNQFDGDYNVLFKDILDDNSIEPSARLESLNNHSKVTKEDINEALSSFLGIEDSMNYYPQIYIPFYEEMSASGKLGSEDPVIIVHLSDTTGNSFTGFQSSDDNDLITTDFLVDESFAQNHEVWVLSINERVDNNGNVKELYKKSVQNGRTQVVVRGLIDRMKITCMKESWTSGSLEVELVAVSTWYGAVNPQTGELNDYNEVGRVPLAYWPRKSVNRGSWRTVGFPIAPDLETDIWGDYYCYVIYEYDVWPSPLRDRPVGPPGTSSEYILRYRSADEEFIGDYISLLDELCTYNQTAGTGCLSLTTLCF